jgi:GIY-YIG catalytic domain-containing protein
VTEDQIGKPPPFNREAAGAVLTPDRLWSRADVLAGPCSVPSSPGVYGWYFRELPWPMDASDCVRHDNMPLLYVGIAPKMPPANGARPSRQTLRDRIRYHYLGNAEGSTLRLTLGWPSR